MKKLHVFRVLDVALILAACAAAQASAQTVYITRTGAKYHVGSCRYLSQSKIAISLSKAKESGYTPCKVCSPPRLVEMEGEESRPELPVIENLYLRLQVYEGNKL